MLQTQGFIIIPSPALSAAVADRKPGNRLSASGDIGVHHHSDIIENIPHGDVQKEVTQSLSLLNTDPNFL